MHVHVHIMYHTQGDLVLDTSDLVVEFVLKLALNAGKLDQVEIDPSSTLVTHKYMYKPYAEVSV